MRWVFYSLRLLNPFRSVWSAGVSNGIELPEVLCIWTDLGTLWFENQLLITQPLLLLWGV